MTPRTDHLIDLYKKRGTPYEEVLREMVDGGYRPTEIGWVLWHVFGLSMPDAVHRATVAIAEREDE